MREAVRVWRGVRGLETKGRDSRFGGLWGGCRRAEEEERRRGSASLGVAFMADL